MLITNYSIRYRTAVFIFAALLLFVGCWSYIQLPREGTPDITLSLINITAVDEGSAPEEIENRITIPLEKEFNNLANVKEIRSTSSESVANITIEFTPEQDIDFALSRVRDKINLARPHLPSDLDDPIVRDFNLSTDQEIFMFTLSGGDDLERLSEIAEDLEDEIEKVGGVLQANVYGLPEREIRVAVSAADLDARGLTFMEVIRAVSRENVTMSAGNIEEKGRGRYQVRVPGEFTTVYEIGDVIVRAFEGGAIYLRDIAEIRDAYKDRDTISRVNGLPCMTIGVQKRARTNAIQIIDEIQKLLDAWVLPDDVKIRVTVDQSHDIRMMLSELENNVISGFLLVVAVLLVFLGVRNSLLVGMAIPFSMLISFVILRLSGETLSMMVLFSLVLSLGMLVDNAIVIVESIYRLHGEGYSKLDAAKLGAAEVAWPVTTSTVTTLGAFTPMLFWPDIMGEFMSYIPQTLIFTLSASLFVGLVINPALCSVFIRRKTGEKKRRPAQGTRAAGRFVGAYMKMLGWALERRVATMVGCVAVLVFTVASMVEWGNGIELFPETDPRDCAVEVRYPEGTDIARVDGTLRAIEKIVDRYDDVKFHQSTAGQIGGMFGGVSGTHVGSVRVRFEDFEDRKGATLALVSKMRDEMPAFAGAEITVERQREGPPTGAPVTIEIAGESFEELSRLSRMIQDAIKDVPGLVDLRDDVEDTKPELRYLLDRERAARQGVDTTNVAMLLRAALYGMEASRFRAGDEEYDITVRLPEAERERSDLLQTLKVGSSRGVKVSLSSVGTLDYAGGLGAITRKDLKRTISVTASNQGRGVDEILKAVKARVGALDIPQGYTVTYTGDNQEMEENSSFLFSAFVIAVGLIMVILVIQFNSAALPVVILLSVLLSLVGVCWGLMICRMKFGVIMTGVGVVSLAGIVVNNAIVLLDCIQQRRREGLEVHDAIIKAGRLRLRPVLLTATTTILGLVPMAIGYSLEVHHWPPKIVMGSETSAWWAPMAVAVIFGLAVSTVLTLVVVPVMYSLVDSLAKVIGRGRGAISSEEPGV